MYKIDRPEPSRQWLEDRYNAMLHIQSKFENDDNFAWIKTELSYPSFEDFTFAYRNGIFCVLVERAENIGGRSFSFGNARRVETLIHECRSNNLTPCIYPVIEKSDGGKVFYGWLNLFHAVTRKLINPVNDTSDERIEISEWELHNWAVQIVKDYIRNEKMNLLSYCDAPGIEPNIWFEDTNGNRCWVEVLHAIYPENDKSFRFEHWDSEVLSYNGYKAVVGFANSNSSCMNKLFRGDGAIINFKGIKQVHKIR